jgi:hypothetical protein
LVAGVVDKGGELSVTDRAFGNAEGSEGDLASGPLTVAGVSIVLVRAHDERAARDVDEVVVVGACRAW